MSHNIDDLLDVIYAIGDAGSDGTKIAIGDPTGARIKIAGTSYERGSMLVSGSPMHGVLSGIFSYYALDHLDIGNIDLSIAGSTANADLGGDGAGLVVFSHIIFNLTSVTGAPIGNAKVQVGTTPAGTEILAATTLTGLTSTSNLFFVTLDGLLNKISDDSTVYVRVNTKDAGAGNFTFLSTSLYYNYL